MTEWAKFETQKSMPPANFGGANKVQNKFLTNVIGQRSKDDEKVPLTNAKKSNPEKLVPLDIVVVPGATSSESCPRNIYDRGFNQP